MYFIFRDNTIVRVTDRLMFVDICERMINMIKRKVDKYPQKLLQDHLHKCTNDKLTMDFFKKIATYVKGKAHITHGSAMGHKKVEYLEMVSWTERFFIKKNELHYVILARIVKREVYIKYAILCINILKLNDDLTLNVSKFI